MKIIPAIDLMDGQVVRLVKGDPNQKTVYSNNPLEIAKKWQSAGADMLHIVDLDATLGRGSNLEIIKKILSEVDVPTEIAGGLRDEPTILEIGRISDRIVLGTLAFKDKETTLKISSSLGKKKVVISVDQINGKIAVNGWQNSIETTLLDGINEFLELGFTEFLLTSISRDGTMRGPDFESLQKACSIDNANVIASGGVSSINDLKQLKTMNPYGVILGKALYENKISIEDAKKI